MTFGIPFSINFPDRLNLLICNMYNAKTSFVQFQASHFTIKNRSKNHVFSKPFLGPPFSHFFPMFSKNGRFWDPLRNPMGSRMSPKIDQVAPNIAKNLTSWRHIRDPGFHETIVILVPLEHRGFYKVIFSM